MSDAASFFDSLPTAPAADPELPGSLELGAFSISLNVADIEASRAFYARLGFQVVSGDEKHYLILKNGETTLGLFHGMFDRNILTFNPGLTNRMERLEAFTNIRKVQERLESEGLELTTRVESADGAGSITLIDPDGNPILIDQFF